MSIFHMRLNAAVRFNITGCIPLRGILIVYFTCLNTTTVEIHVHSANTFSHILMQVHVQIEKKS